MKWLERVVKGPSYYKVGVYESRYGYEDGRGQIQDYKCREALEDEELDHAIALSLSEIQYMREKGSQASQVHADEDLARALQESLDLQQCPLPIQHSSSKRRFCAGCKNEIGLRRFLSCIGSVWHPECFRCYACDTPISDDEFSMSRNSPYHKSCYKELFHPRCDVCKEFIPINFAGLIEYKAHPFWGQTYCPSHEMDRTPRCCSCERVESKDAKYISLGDGRKLCLECLGSAVMDTGECQPLYHQIRDFYEGMNMRIEQQIPMLLVERQALNEAMEGEKHGYHHIPETRGLCLSEEQTVNTIFRRPSIGPGNRILNMRMSSQRLNRHCEVTAILVLYGLPRLLTGSILAHELMHAWLRLNGFRNLEPYVEEGICQVLAHLWLESEVIAGPSSSSSSSKKSKAPKSNIEKKLGEFFLHQIAMDTSPVYGEGFRAANGAVLQYGMRRTLDHIKSTSTFPP